jgi:hypothetical protein
MPALRISQLLAETLAVPDSGALVSQRAVEVLMAYTTPSPTTPTGAGVSQLVAEALFIDSSPRARVSQVCVEVLFSAATTGEGGAVGGGSDTTSFGYAV